jgi:hypothetical protein
VSRRILFVILFGVVFIGAAAFAILTLTRADPASERATRAEAPPAAPAPVAPVVITPPPSAPAPPSTTRPAEPRRRSPAPEASPAPAAAAAPPAGPTLHVDSDVPGAQVFVDRIFVGKTPLTTTAITTGSHRLNLSAPGYEGVAQSIEVAPGGQDIVVNLREVKLDVKLEVVHKHRIGSCTGQLVATPQGMRYETANKDDAFTTPLLDLETFEVDYLEKNLRIKPRQGKRYDFTDPQGNPDHLFVFHRDVDKARDRLKKGDPPAAAQ